ncbi:MAG: transporter substrate-binding domain-containing protein [Pseudomonadota bacterium]
MKLKIALKNIITAVILIGVGTVTYAKPLVWATEATYPPFESTNAQGKIVGMDIDIANAICQQMKTTCQFVNAPWDSLIPSLKLGKFDIIFGGMNITPARAKQVSFTQAYYTAPAEVVAAKGAKLSLSQSGLKGKTIGTQKGNTFQFYLQHTYGSSIDIKTYASVQQAFIDLKNGRLDAVMSDQPTVQHWLEENNHKQHYQVVGNPIHDKQYFGAGYGIAVKKGNTVLLNKLNKAIAALKQNGKLSAIINKYMKQ